MPRPEGVPLTLTRVVVQPGNGNFEIVLMTFLPRPSAAWVLDGSRESASGGPVVALQPRCSANWTDYGDGHEKALRTDAGCYGLIAHVSSLSAGAGSMSACLRFRSTIRGAPLLFKIEHKGRGFGSRGFGLEVGEEHGLGVSLADQLGVCVHQELGRHSLADGKWHHACAILQRKPRALLAVYVDGRLSESLGLDSSRLWRLGSVDSSAPLLLGRRSLDEPSTTGTALREVAIWSRALLPEQVAALARVGFKPHRTHRPANSSRRVHPTMVASANEFLFSADVNAHHLPGPTHQPAVQVTNTFRSAAIDEGCRTQEAYGFLLCRRSWTGATLPVVVILGLSVQRTGRRCCRERNR